MPKKDNRLIIYEKMNGLIFYSKNLLTKFPKSERFDLCTDIKENLYSNLRTMTRLSYEYKYITPKNYMVWNEKISEIGKMIGGWLKTCQKE